MKEYEKNLLELMEQENAIGGDGEFYLDFSNPAHQENFYARYGGKETMEREFPDLYKTVQNTIKAARTDMRLLRKGESCGSLKDGVKIRDIVFQENLIGASGLVSLCQKSPRIYISLSLLKKGEIIKRERSFYHDISDAILDCLQKEQSVMPGEGVECIMNVSWEDPATNLLKDCSRSLHAVIPEEDVIKSVELYHPCLYHPCTKPGSMPDLTFIKGDATGNQPLEPAKKEDDPRKRTSINVCYARTPGGRDVSDYIYKEGRVKSLQETYLDIRGSVELNPGYTFKNIHFFDIVLDCVGNGVIPYSGKPVKNVHYYATDKGFNFVLPTNWEQTIPDSVMYGNRLYYLEGDISFYCNEAKEAVSVHISGRGSITPLEEHFVEIKPIRLFWGCIAENTRIRMADGSEKMIQDIRSGDQVEGQNGPDRVLDVINGWDSDMYVVNGENLEELFTTANHPVMTKAGWKSAGELLVEDSILLQNGGYVQVEHHYPVDKNTIVYNLVLEEHHNFYANGYLVGDNEAQGAYMAVRSKTDSIPVRPELEAECRKLREMFGGK